MEIISLSPSIPIHRRRIECFLHDSGLRYDDLDYYAALVDEADGEIVAGGGLKRDVIKCVAVADAYKGEAIVNSIVSHLIAKANSEGYHCVRLFTKPRNRRVFESLSFRLLAEAPEAILMETGVGGIEEYKKKLNAIASQYKNQPFGCIVMNANPFTLGHRFLIEQASSQVERLFVVLVKEDCSMFSYAERKEMVSRGINDMKNVTLCDGSDYAVSATTFPTYFLKTLSDASDTQMLLDLDLFRRHIAPALGTSVRFVGTEPSDALTRRYNELMKQELDDVREIERLGKDGEPLSASRVRHAIEAGCLRDAARLVPLSTLPYIIAHLATRALQAELSTTPKPGLVDLHDSGAHRDMDYALMQRSIAVLRPYFVRLAQLPFSSCPNHSNNSQLPNHSDNSQLPNHSDNSQHLNHSDNFQLPNHSEIARIGIEAERAMLDATGGVNTHKGALFSLGLAVVATMAAITGRGGALAPDMNGVSIKGRGSALAPDMNGVSITGSAPASADSHYIMNSLSRLLASIASQFPDTHDTHGSKAKKKSNGLSMAGKPQPLSQLKGALDNAREGYPQLFSHWLPFYVRCVSSGDSYALHKTLLRIMCDLDDTNIVYRADLPTMQSVKTEARQLLNRFSVSGLEAMNRDFIARNISPGGSADMLSLVVFFHSVLNGMNGCFLE